MFSLHVKSKPQTQIPGSRREPITDWEGVWWVWGEDGIRAPPMHAWRDPVAGTLTGVLMIIIITTISEIKVHFLNLSKNDAVAATLRDWAPV